MSILVVVNAFFLLFKSKPEIEKEKREKYRRKCEGFFFSFLLLKLIVPQLIHIESYRIVFSFSSLFVFLLKY